MRRVVCCQLDFVDLSNHFSFLSFSGSGCVFDFFSSCDFLKGVLKVWFRILNIGPRWRLLTVSSLAEVAGARLAQVSCLC